jgi:3-isopropylmalate dehydrogenase
MKLAVIRGDGIGPEVVGESLKVLQAICEKESIKYQVEEFPFGADYFLETGISIPEAAFGRFTQEFTAILFGAVGDPRIPSNDYAKQILLGIRSKLDLYVNLRPVRLLNERFCPLKNQSEKDIDFVVIRENTEDLYTGSGGIFRKNTPDEMAIENSIHTRKGIERIIRYAFLHAREKKRGSVLMSDKRNAMVYAGDLWKRTFADVGKEFPDIEKRHMLIDALHMEVIRQPEQFEVIVTSNMFGDILTDLTAQLQGGMGLGGSANINPEYERFKGFFEPIHGSAPDIAGKQLANPMASVLSLSLLLEHHGYQKAAAIVVAAVKHLLERNLTTPDLGGHCTTSEVGDAICDHIFQSQAL